MIKKSDLDGDDLIEFLFQEVIVDITEGLAEAQLVSGMEELDIALKMDVSVYRVRMLLGGGSELTIRSLVEIANVIGHKVKISLECNDTEVLE